MNFVNVQEQDIVLKVQSLSPPLGAMVPSKGLLQVFHAKQWPEMSRSVRLLPGNSVST